MVKVHFVISYKPRIQVGSFLLYLSEFIDQTEARDR